MPRPRRPDHLKAVAGTEERYRNHNEPQPETAGVDLKVPPRGLGAGPSRVWRRLAPDLVKKRMLTPWDVDAFSAYCIAVAQYNDIRRAVTKNGTVTTGSQGQLVVSPYFRAQHVALDAMMRLGARFGLTPGDRANIAMVADTDLSPSTPGGPDSGPSGPLGPERLLS